ncbi:MAG: alpha/beta hydrolase [Saprospiraceae bacterium]|nr:alpha/beta hydrolase [Saprospiraceae bacterium]
MTVFRFSLPTLLLSALFACQSPSTTERHTAPIDQGFEHEGVQIHYTVAGSGDTSLVLIHGWCINRGYWSEQVAYFSPRYRVVAPDLPGFGASGKNRTTWSIEQYGADIAALIDHLQLKNVILVGHSMSGDVMLHTAALRPREVIGLVGIDNLADVGHTLTAAEHAGVKQFFEALQQDYPTVVAEFAKGNLFHPSTDSLVRRRVLADFTSADPAIATAALEGLFAFSSQEAARIAALRVPLSLVNSDANPTDTATLHRLCRAGFRLLPVPATGHYPMIEKPELFNRALERVLRKG